jgi:hypothetical protein
MRLAPLQRTNFTVGQRATVDTVGDPLLLVHVALYVGLHTL